MVVAERVRKILIAVGTRVISFVREVGASIQIVIAAFRYLPRSWQDRHLIFKQMLLIGNDSLPLVLLIGGFTGAIAALQATNLFDKFNLLGVARPYLGGSIATVVFTELAPVLTALVIAGRIGGAMTAELGTMAVSEQLDALEIMAVDKYRFLALPRIFAALVMIPLLTVFSNVVALLGAMALLVIKFQFSEVVFWTSIQRYFLTSEVVLGLFKSALFGGVTAVVACRIGFRTTGGAEGVGISTVQAFTIIASAILVLDALIGYLF